MKLKQKVFLLLAFILSFTLVLEAAAPAPIQSNNGIAISSVDIATKIGNDVLKDGGNAFDAAVAIGYALAVVHPVAGNLGGGGFAIIRTKDGKNLALDFREAAPQKASANMYLDKNGKVIEGASTGGYLSAGVPGTVAGLEELRQKYGTMSRERLMEPSIMLAEEGYAMPLHQAKSMQAARDKFLKFASSKSYFLKKDGSDYKEGDLFIQKDLSTTLKAIEKDGRDGFYKGKVADLIVKDMEKNHGIITKEDLADYKVIWRTPVVGTYRGYTIVSMPPPSSGGVHLIEMLNIMENANLAKLGFNSASTINIMAEAMRQAYADRSAYLGDPNFVKNMPIDTLDSKEYAKKVFEEIRVGSAKPSKDVKPGLGVIKAKLVVLPEGNNTTHYSVADKFGNAVSVTYSINEAYGSGASIEGAGFLLNNTMDDFSIKAGVPNAYGLVGGRANEIQPNKRPLSSMTPTIVLKGNDIYMVVGSPGGSRIITTVLQVISNVIDHGMDISHAVYAPRFHMQWLPDELRVEKDTLNKDTERLLKEMGYTISVQPDMGDVNAIMIPKKDGIFYASPDPRKEY
ncbi:gamma-glutamyltransferase [Helicobacter sp. 11S02629-2]|uniref:gamma-glutamyltransferase n=1 Tax=Helicobacter sp. 11S02629-2 TaxID=1476195 RepID=UPI000BA730FC|nr:gamma-glutamyltransferase [Helicobacter sp. 11S02629-2]PAF46030.1 gamma-glutamyltransferase [Helicobacter sp. 11S02629-2]